MADKNAEQLKSYYTELAKLAPGQDWERILKTAKKSIPNLDAEKQFSHDQNLNLFFVPSSRHIIDGKESISDQDYLLDKLGQVRRGSEQH